MNDICLKIVVKSFRKYKLKSGFNSFNYNWFDVEKIVFSFGIRDSYGIEIILIYKK